MERYVEPKPSRLAQGVNWIFSALVFSIRWTFFSNFERTACIVICCGLLLSLVHLVVGLVIAAIPAALLIFKHGEVIDMCLFAALAGVAYVFFSPFVYGPRLVRTFGARKIAIALGGKTVAGAGAWYLDLFNALVVLDVLLCVVVGYLFLRKHVRKKSEKEDTSAMVSTT